MVAFFLLEPGILFLLFFSSLLLLFASSPKLPHLRPPFITSVSPRRHRQGHTPTVHLSISLSQKSIQQPTQKSFSHLSAIHPFPHSSSQHQNHSKAHLFFSKSPAATNQITSSFIPKTTAKQIILHSQIHKASIANPPKTTAISCRLVLLGKTLLLLQLGLAASRPFGAVPPAISVDPAIIFLSTSVPPADPLPEHSPTPRRAPSFFQQIRPSPPSPSQRRPPPRPPSSYSSPSRQSAPLPPSPRCRSGLRASAPPSPLVSTGPPTPVFSSAEHSSKAAHTRRRHLLGAAGVPPVLLPHG